MRTTRMSNTGTLVNFWASDADLALIDGYKEAAGFTSRAELMRFLVSQAPQVIFPKDAAIGSKRA